jgi:hypothetical protein
VKIDRNDTRPMRGFLELNCFCLRIKPFLQREKPLVCLELLFEESETLNITTLTRPVRKGILGVNAFWRMAQGMDSSDNMSYNAKESCNNRRAKAEFHSDFIYFMYAFSDPRSNAPNSIKTRGVSAPILYSKFPELPAPINFPGSKYEPKCQAPDTVRN